MPSWYHTVNRFADPVGAARIATFVDILQRFPVGHLVDLGAGHGVFSRIAAGMGWRVTAVDVRAVRFPDDEAVTWVVSDIRTFDDYDDVDVVACLGLWYHLSLEDQVQLAGRIAPRPMILDTHVAVDTDLQRSRGLMSPVVRQQGYTGRLYDESGLQDQPTASWGNLASFWPTLPSLERLMYGAGYDVVERYEPAYLNDRGFFTARSLGGAAARRELDQQIERFNRIEHPDAEPVSSVLSLTSELSPATATARTPVPPPAAAAAARTPVLPIRTAARQFAVAARASAQRKAGQLRAMRGGHPS